jgi:ABC-type transport system involved in multi-copper enzyme maturation permease subunit
MLSVLLWKEYREHRIVWAALAFVAAASLLFLPFVMAPGGLESHPDVRNILRVLVIALAWTYGLVCGAMLLAGEREVGTLPFLDALPGLRWRLWLAKCIAGLLLVAAQIVLVMLVATAAHLFTNGFEAAWTLYGMVWAGLYGFAWGMLFSSFGRSVMNMILLALAAQFAVVFVTSLFAGFLAALATIASGKPAGDDAIRFWGPVAAGVALLTIAPALAGSAFLFTRLDRGRLQPPRITTARARKPHSPGWLVLFWLAWRQARGFALGLAIFGLVAGFLIPALGPLVWPAATLLVGMLCGVTAFDDEQQGPFRYLGDQRLPLLRLWIVKVGVRLSIALTAAILMAMPSCTLALFISEASAFSRAFAGLVITSGPILFLTMGLVYGFCIGVLCGLLFRSILASAVSAIFLSLLLAAVWLPSLLASGLHGWQPLGPPILLLASTPFLLRPWAAGRIASWTTAKRLTPFVVLAGLWIAGGLWYRVLEIPNVPEQVDLEAVRATLPTEKENQAGELVRRACVSFGDLSRKLFDEQPRDAHPGIAQPHLVLIERAENVLDHGWSGDDPELAAWLNKIIGGKWFGVLKEAADLPPGMVEDMRNLTFSSPRPAADNSTDVTLVLAARGLQRQAAGDDEAFVENFRMGLKLSLAMRHRAPIRDVYRGQEHEVLLLKALDRWMERLHGRPDLLHQALDILTQYADAPKGDDEQDLMEDLMIMNMVKDPIPWLKHSLTFNEDVRIDDLNAQMEAQWVATAWLAPWEHERQQRLLRVLFWGDDVQRKAVSANTAGPLWWYAYKRGKPNRLTNVALERAGLLKLALRWYQADNGKPAETLDQLVPKYLPSIPVDPFDPEEKPLRYRLSRGEEIDWPPDPLPPGGAIPPPAPVGVIPPGAAPADVAPPPANLVWPPPPPTRKIPAGQGILWSVGEDKIDDGGRRQAGAYNGQLLNGQDVIYLVPLPAKGK